MPPKWIRIVEQKAATERAKSAKRQRVSYVIWSVAAIRLRRGGPIAGTRSRILPPPSAFEINEWAIADAP